MIFIIYLGSPLLENNQFLKSFCVKEWIVCEIIPAYRAMPGPCLTAAKGRPAATLAIFPVHRLSSLQLPNTF
jgi:hypothetical protein